MNSGLRRATVFVSLIVSLGSARLAFGEADPSALPHGLADTWSIDPAHPELSLPSRERMAAEPLKAGYYVMEMSALADAAMKQHRYADAARFFDVLAELVPERAVAFARSCEAYEALGEGEAALRRCREALGKDGARVADSARYIGLLLARSGPLRDADQADVAATIEHLRRQGADAAIVSRLDCQMAVRLGDEARLAECSSALNRLVPNDPRTVTFAWALAEQQGDYGRASDLLARARDTGVEASLLSDMTRQTRALRFRWFELHARALALGVSCGLLALAVFVFLRRRSPSGAAQKGAATA